MIGGAFGLLSYIDFEDNKLTKEQILQKLDWFIYHGNNRTYDMIDYEWLVFIEEKYGKNEKYSEIMEKIFYLKRMIAKNYALKKKLENRLILK